jgi:hypothetical protein
MPQSFFLCFFSCSLFSCSRTTVTATWKPWGCPWFAASTKLSQAAFRLLYLSETSRTEKQWLGAKVQVQVRDQDEDEQVYLRLTPPRPCNARVRPGNE